MNPRDEQPKARGASRGVRDVNPRDAAHQKDNESNNPVDGSSRHVAAPGVGPTAPEVAANARDENVADDAEHQPNLTAFFSGELTSLPDEFRTQEWTRQSPVPEAEGPVPEDGNAPSVAGSSELSAQGSERLYNRHDIQRLWDAILGELDEADARIADARKDAEAYLEDVYQNLDRIQTQMSESVKAAGQDIKRVRAKAKRVITSLVVEEDIDTVVNDLGAPTSVDAMGDHTSRMRGGTTGNGERGRIQYLDTNPRKCRIEAIIVGHRKSMGSDTHRHHQSKVNKPTPTSKTTPPPNHSPTPPPHGLR